MIRSSIYIYIFIYKYIQYISFNTLRDPIENSPAFLHESFCDSWFRFAVISVRKLCLLPRGYLRNAWMSIDFTNVLGCQLISLDIQGYPRNAWIFIDLVDILAF